VRTLLQTVDWSRRNSFPQPLPEPGHKAYSPRLRRDQIKALFYLKELEGRPMTKLAQEAVDRFLDERGGAGAVIARGRAVLDDGDGDDDVRRRRGPR
jgi:hypothetical protein